VFTRRLQTYVERWFCVAVGAWYCVEEYVELLTAAGNRTCQMLTDDLRLLSVATVPLCQTVDSLRDDLIAALLGLREVDLHKTVMRFFDELFSRVVRRHVLRITAVDQQVAAVDVDHAACIRSLRRTLRPDPLGTVDDRFAEDVARAINSSRVLLDALRTASRTAAAVTEDWPTSRECRRALTRLRMCALCDGRPDWATLRPCRGLCVNVARGCLATVAFELGPRWESFVDGLALLVARSHGPHHLEFVSKSLDETVAGGVLQVIRNAPRFYLQVNLPLSANGVAQINEVTLRRDRLVLRWVTPWYLNQPPRLSQAISP